MPAPVTRSCGCSKDHLCPTAQSLRKKVNESMPPFEAPDNYSPDAWQEYHRALADFRRHVGGSR